MTTPREDSKDKLPPARDGALPVDPDEDIAEALHERHEDTEVARHKEGGHNDAL